MEEMCVTSDTMVKRITFNHWWEAFIQLQN